MFARLATSGKWATLVLLLAAAQVYAQDVSPRRHGGPDRELPDPSAASTQPAPAQPVPTQPVPAQPQQTPAPVSQVAPSMLQQPAGEAQVVFTGDTLSIRADNSSLSAILHQVASKSGMQIDGLSGDERVFGTFGPGAPRDVLADLLNGTAYNLVLLGDLGDGAPRELILTPATRAAGATPAAAPATTIDQAANEPEAEAPPPDIPPPGTTPPPPAPGVKTPQQLFEQLQRMRAAQQQQITSQPEPSQQQQPQQ